MLDFNLGVAMLKSYVLLLLLSFSILSCSRSLKESAVVKIQFSQNSQNLKANKISTLNNPMIGRLMLNFHYDGKVETYVWEMNDNCTTAASCSPPSEINFGNKSFPAGSKRIIQVLLLMDDGSGAKEFWYSDSGFINIVNGTNTIQLDDWHSHGPILNETNVAGRITDANNLPISGEIIGQIQPTLEDGFSPDESKPAMTVLKSFAFDGWFDLKFFDNLPITYKTVSGQMLFKNKLAIELSSTDNKAHAVFLRIPEHLNLNWNSKVLNLPMPSNLETLSFSCTNCPQLYSGGLTDNLFVLKDNDSITGIKAVSTMDLAKRELNFIFDEAVNLRSIKMGVQNNNAHGSLSSNMFYYYKDGVPYGFGQSFDMGINTNFYTMQKYFNITDMNAEDDWSIEMINFVISGSYLISELEFEAYDYRFDSRNEENYYLGYFTTQNEGEVKHEASTLTATNSKIYYSEPSMYTPYPNMYDLDESSFDCENTFNICTWPLAASESAQKLKWKSDFVDPLHLGFNTTSHFLTPASSNPSCQYQSKAVGSCLNLDLKRNIANRDIIPFRGPFNMIKSSFVNELSIEEEFFTFVDVKKINGETSRKLTWSYLPNMASFVDGTMLFVLSGELKNSDDAPCSALAKKRGINVLADGFINESTPNIIDHKQIVFNNNFQSIILPNYSAVSNAQVYLCPYKVVSGAFKFYPYIVRAHEFSNTQNISGKVLDYTVAGVSPATLSPPGLLTSVPYPLHIEPVGSLSKSGGSPYFYSLDPTNYLKWKSESNNSRSSFYDGITFSVWFKISSYNASNPAYLFSCAVANCPLNLSVTNTSVDIEFKSSDNSSVGTLSVASALAVGSWYHIVVSYDPLTGISSYFLNGAPISSYTNPAPGKRLVAPQAYYYIGQNVSISASVSSIDLSKVEIWNHALTQQQAIDLHTTSRPPDVNP